MATISKNPIPDFGKFLTSKGVNPTDGFGAFGTVPQFNNPVEDAPLPAFGGNGINMQTDNPSAMDTSLPQAQGLTPPQEPVNQPFYGGGFQTNTGVFNQGSTPEQSFGQRETTNPNATPVGGALRRQWREFYKRRTGQTARIDARPTLSRQASSFYRPTQDGGREVNFSKLDQIERNRRT